MEMVSAKAISFHNKNTEALMEIDPGEHPVSMQLFGSEPDLMAEVAKSIEERPFDILDINMGCPVPKVVNNGEGSALLKNPKLIEEIVRSVSGAVSKPVTVKYASDLMKTHRWMWWRSQNGRRMQAQQLLLCMEGPDSSIIPVRRTGMLSAG